MEVVSANESEAFERQTDPPIANDDNESPKQDHYYFAYLRRDRPSSSDRMVNTMSAALCFMMVLTGCGAGCFGPLIPYLQDFYQIDYIKVSVYSITIFVGGVCAGVMIIWLNDRFGFGITAFVGVVAQMAAYAIWSWGPPYPVSIVMCALIGYGFALTDAQVNGLAARLPNAHRHVFIVQACFGVGALIAPLVATAFAQAVPRAYLFFAVPAGMCFLGGVIVLIVFRGRTTAQLIGRQSQSPVNEISHETDKQISDAAVAQNVAPPSSGSKFRRMMSQPRTWITMIWSLCYIGCEIAVGVWATSYLIHERGGGKSSGYVSTGYYAGLTLGRVVLMPFSGKVGYHVAIQAFTIAAGVFQLLSWLIPNLYASAFFLSIVGFCFGPIWPAMLMLVGDLVDDDLREGLIGILGATAGAGSALMPFAIGALSDRYGIWVMQPFCFALEGTCFALWACLPVRSPLRDWITRRLRSTSK